MNSRLVRVVCGQAMLGIDTVDADEGFVHEGFFSGPLSDVADQGKPITGQRPTSHANVDVREVTQLHSDVDGVGQYSDSLSMANAPSDLGCSRAGADGDDIAVVNQAGGF